MRIGINFASPRTLPVIHALFDQGLIDFCEITVDNVAHLTADSIRQALSCIPVSLHLVASRFLEKSAEELTPLAAALRPWIHALRPIYVSDHLVRYTTPDGRRLPMIAELDYENDYAHIRNRVIAWQSLLDTPLFFENHASMTPAGKHQAAFYSTLISDTGAGLLFDFSNAYIAEQNHAGVMEAWDALIRTAKHFHVGGFRWEASSQLALDTHDAPIANEVSHIIKHYLSGSGRDKTLVIEFDKEREVASWKKDIINVSPR